MTGALVLIGLVLVGGAAAAWPKIRWQLRARALHRALSRANALSVEQSRWLWRLGRRVHPANPELVFVRPSLFRAGGAGGETPMAAAVRDKLFDG